MYFLGDKVLRRGTVREGSVRVVPGRCQARAWHLPGTTLTPVYRALLSLGLETLSDALRSSELNSNLNVPCG